MREACPECGRSDDYEEITLADLVDTLRRRKKILAGVFVAVLLGSLLVTVTQDPVYESTAVLVATNEREELLALINSDAYEEAILESIGDHASISGVLGPMSTEDEQRTEITLTFRGEVADIQNAGEQAIQALEQLQSELRNVTWSKNWQAYYEAAGKDEAKATAQLQTLVDGMTYYEVVSEPSAGAKVSPNVQLNLALGVVLGLMIGVFGVFGVEWWSNYKINRSSKRQ